MKSMAPGLVVALYVGTGIVVARLVQIPLWCLWVLLCMGCGLSIYWQRTHRKQVQWALAISLIILGIFRYQQGLEITGNHITQLTPISEPIILKGILLQDPVIKPNRTSFIMKVSQWVTPDSVFAIQGTLIVGIYDSLYLPLQYGDQVRLTGKLSLPGVQRNPGGFDYRAYLNKQGVHAQCYVKQGTDVQKVGGRAGSKIMQSLILPVRRWTGHHLDYFYRGESRHMLSALLLGDRTHLSEEIRDDYAKAGIIHTLAVSGLHVGFVTVIAMTFFGFLRLPRKGVIMLTLLALPFYMAVAQFKPPVERATLMACILLAGLLLERKPHIYNSLGIAAFIILLVHPAKLFDVGFQLSFTAMASILFFYEQFGQMEWINRVRKRWNTSGFQWLISGILVSLAAQIGTLPITASYFYRIPILSLPLNLLAIPLTGLIVCLAFLGIFFSLISPWIALSYTILTDCLLKVMMAGTHWIAQLPFAQLTIARPDPIEISLYFLACLILFTAFSFRKKKIILFALLTLANIDVWVAVYQHREPVLRWVQLDVGQGDAAVLHLPRGKTVLIDGGDHSRSFDAGRHVIAPYLNQQGIRELDAVILSHPHHDHMGGLSYVIDKFKTHLFVTANTPFDTELNRQLKKRLEEKQIPLRIVTAPDSLSQFPGILMRFIWPTAEEKAKARLPHANLNNQSLVLQLSFGQNSLLFPGDAERPVEKQMLTDIRNQPRQFLKVGHHGSKTSSSEAFLDKYKPDVAVISVGSSNRFGHPSPAIIDAYHNRQIGLFRTDRQGAIIACITPSRYHFHSCLKDTLSTNP